MKHVCITERRILLAVLLLLTACSKNPADPSEPAKESGHLYVANYSPATITIENVEIDGKLLPANTTWKLPPDRYTILTVDTNNVSVQKMYPSGTVIRFDFWWESDTSGASYYTGATVELEGTMTGKFRYDPFALGRVSFFLEKGDTRNQP